MRRQGLMCFSYVADDLAPQPVFMFWKLTIETPEQGVKYVEHILHLFVVFL